LTPIFKHLKLIEAWGSGIQKPSLLVSAVNMVDKLRTIDSQAEDRDVIDLTETSKTNDGGKSNQTKNRRLLESLWQTVITRARKKEDILLISHCFL